MTFTAQITWPSGIPVTPKVYKWTGPTGVRFKQIREPSGTYYHHKTPREVISTLEAAREVRRRVRLYLGDTKTGKNWGEEWGTIGRISRSMGPITVPILLANSRSSGGAAILDACIVGIQAMTGRWLYRHPKLNLGIWTAGPAKSEGCTEAAYRDGELHAQFSKPGAAGRYCQFMRGERMAK